MVAQAPTVDLGFFALPVRAPAVALDALAIGYYAVAAVRLDLDGSRARRRAFMDRFWPLQAGCFVFAFYEHRAPR